MTRALRQASPHDVCACVERTLALSASPAGMAPCLDGQHEPRLARPRARQAAGAREAQGAPVQALPSFRLAMIMACLESSATCAMSADHTTYFTNGVLISARLVRCCTSKSTICARAGRP